MQGLNSYNGNGSAAGRPVPHRAVMARPQPVRGTAKRGPSPSRLAYRLHRIWLRPLYRRILRLGAPAFLIALIAGIYLSDDTRRAQIAGDMTAMVEKIQTRDEFMVHRMEIEGASEVVDKGLRGMLPVTLPASSFDINLDELRAAVMKLDAVADVQLRIKPGGVLAAVVKEREPTLLWRHTKGIELLDKTGHRVASVTSRDVRNDLPVIAGDGAEANAVEAMELIRVAGPLLPRLRGLERIGARRWDVVLDRGQRIMLPEDRAVAALEAVLTRDASDDLLARDVVAVDLRDLDRPILRLGLTAQNTLRRARGEPELGADGRVIEPDAKETTTAKSGAKTAAKKNG